MRGCTTTCTTHAAASSHARAVTGRGEIDGLRSRIIDTVDDIVQLRRPPPAAARELERLRTELVTLGAALDPFVGLAAEWDYDPDRRDELERQILNAAETLRRNFDT